MLVQVTKTYKTGFSFVVTPEILKEIGLVKKQLDGVKVLGISTLTKKLTVKATMFSKTAKEKIEKIGGKAEVI